MFTDGPDRSGHGDRASGHKNIVFLGRGARAVPSTMSSRPRALTLYRELLRTMERWPSIKKDKVVAEIRSEFREKMGELDATKKAKFMEEAEAGLRALQQQVGMNTDRNDVSYAYDEMLQGKPPPGSRR